MMPASLSKEQDAQLEALLLVGLASPGLPLDDAFLKNLQSKAAAILAKSQSQKS